MKADKAAFYKLYASPMMSLFYKFKYRQCDVIERMFGAVEGGAVNRHPLDKLANNFETVVSLVCAIRNLQHHFIRCLGRTSGDHGGRITGIANSSSTD
ncbi:hypothetical protein EMIT0324P_10265 [Pseudomonas chlororaphis]